MYIPKYFTEKENTEAVHLLISILDINNMILLRILEPRVG